MDRSLRKMLQEDRNKVSNLNKAARENNTTKAVDKWGFIREGPEQSNINSAENKRKREKETQRAEKWVAMLAWNLHGEEKRKEITKRFRKGLPDRLRGDLWKKICRVDEFRKEVQPNLFQNLLKQESTYESQINKDLTRTFPKHVFFQSGQGQTSLFKALKAYSIYDTAVGYVQGMGFITALLLLYMTEEDAFIILARLLKDWNMAGLYLPDFPLLYQYLYIHDQLLESNLPRLAAHFKSEVISTTSYAAEWYTTLFVSRLPFAHVIRIWDIFFVEGVAILFKVAVALLKFYQNDLVKYPLEKIMEKLKNLSNIPLSPDELITKALEISITGKKLEKLGKQYVSGGGGE